MIKRDMLTDDSQFVFNPGTAMTYQANPAEFITIGEIVTVSERGRDFVGQCIADGGDGKQFWFVLRGTRDARGKPRKVLAVLVGDAWTVLQGDGHAR